MTEEETDLSPEVNEEELVRNTTVEIEGEEEGLVDLIRDVELAHKELDQYKSGAMALCTAFDERIVEASASGDYELTPILQDVRNAAFAVYLRLQRGDLELLGKRDGKHSGYLVNDGDGE